jgi:hypothetical protein
MSPTTDPLFPPRNERPYDAPAVETFPWPVTAGYEDLHRWMDENQAVHPALQLHIVWVGLLQIPKNAYCGGSPGRSTCQGTAHQTQKALSVRMPAF